jgi:hypothetical protein
MRGFAPVRRLAVPNGGMGFELQGGERLKSIVMPAKAGIPAERAAACRRMRSMDPSLRWGDRAFPDRLDIGRIVATSEAE